MAVLYQLASANASTFLDFFLIFLSAAGIYSFTERDFIVVVA